MTMTRVAAALLLIAAGTLPARAGQEVIERILVKVNGDILTKTDLEQRQIAALRQRNQPFNPADLQNDERLKTILAEITPEILVNAIDELLIVQRGKELGYRLSAEQFDETLASIKKENKLETEEQFQAALKQEGMTLDDLRRLLEKEFLIRRVQADIGQNIQLTEDQARAYYDAHPAEFTKAATVTLREILVEAPPFVRDGQRVVNAAEEERLAERAAGIRTRLLAGEDFAKVAAEVSDAPSKANGGLIGPLDLADLAPALQEQLKKLKPGEISEPLRSARGYQILKVEELAEPSLQPFDQVRDLIADKVYVEKRNTEFDAYIRKLRAQAIIEWKSEDLKTAYERRIAAEAAGAKPGV